MNVMTEEWVSFWYQCLCRNLDYDNYCVARQNIDVERCQELEKQFEHIAEIYKDFDDVSDGFDGLNSESWKDWFEPRKHLFIPEIKLITDPSKYIASKDHILINVPLLEVKSDTEKLLKQFLTDYYTNNEVVPAPKYQLLMNGNRVAYGYQQVRQACIAGFHSYREFAGFRDGEGEGDLSYKKTVANFIRREIDNLGWGIQDNERHILETTGLLTEDQFDKFKPRVVKYRNEFKALARNVLRNRFPDMSSFDSNVTDYFNT